MSPAQQLTDGLLQGRADGLPFEFAWSAALDRVCWPHDDTERAEWRQALAWAKDEFEDSYTHPELQPAYIRRLMARELEAGLTGAALAQLAAAV